MNAPLDTISGSVLHITYCDKTSDFVVASLRTSRGLKIPIIGVMPDLQAGETIHATGKLITHPKYGKQFEVESYTFELPQSKKAIEKFLSQGAIDGIGAGFAKKIVALFGDKTLEVIDKNPEKLASIPGLGKKRQKTIQDAWKKRKLSQEVFLFLADFGISRTLSRRILRSWGHYTIQKIKENPYLLAKEINTIGFTKADLIATHVGLEKDSPHRIEAGIDYLLHELSQEGHVCHPLPLFLAKAEKMLQVAKDLIELQIGRMHKEEAIELRSIENRGLYIWSKSLYASEQGIAYELHRLQKEPQALRSIDIEKAITWAEARQGITYAEKQKEALRSVIQNKCSIITGGPGTGKSTITKALILIYEKLTKRIALAAPTGRAAKRMREITGRYALTIHRLLKFDFIEGGFKHNKDNPLDIDMLILDEASMIDTFLMYQLLRAIPHRAKVVIIGDKDQLPSIGPGHVLQDLIEEASIPTAQLSLIFRQGKNSQIILNAHKINHGEMPFLNAEEKPNDFIFIEKKEPEELSQAILEVVTTKIPEHYGYDPKKDIQVLAPIRKGPCGIEILNRMLQEKLTPIRSSGPFRVGDKVIQLKNNYSKEVYNGDIGFVDSYDEETNELSVLFDEKRVSYEPLELDELALAYAVSIHKYQGSEAPVIVMPIHTTHFMMLNKNLLYTGVTRGKKLVILVGTKKAVAISVRNQRTTERYTALQHALKAYGVEALP